MNGLNFELIIKTRKGKKFKLQEMADALGITSASEYYKYEKGIYKFKAHHLPLLAAKLELSMESIFLAA